MSLDPDLKNRRALVTGGTRGIGAAVVDVLREAGARVVTTARRVPADPHADLHYIAADVTTAEGCAAVAEGTLGKLGGIDILINVVGGSSAPPSRSSRSTMQSGERNWTAISCPPCVSTAPSCHR